ncbi:MAG: D-alanine--D-alanine ligase [bacterium]|nr:D-alanine--D-alanine ligase [bacterium]
MGKKIRVCVLFGGKSGEHEVSLKSATSVIASLDRSKYEVLPVKISREGQSLPPEFVALLSSSERPYDVVFPVLHGPYGEDGTLQGFLELAGVPFVGSDTLSSALAMDKLMAKKVFFADGIPTPPYWFFRAGDEPDISSVFFPCVVKPMNSGSSVGISIVRKEDELQEALRKAFPEDRKGEVLVEKYIAGQEITVPVLGDRALPVILIRPKKDGAWFDYEVKYNSDLVDEIVPAPLPEDVTARVQALALRAHQALKCRHISRTDMIIEEGTGGVYVLEVNTMPGMTSASLFPKAAKAAGISFPELLDRLIGFALEK